MPLYDFLCPNCGFKGELFAPIIGRDHVLCQCGTLLARQVATPMGRVAGRIPQGGGPDRFTADMLGVPLKELPEGLKVKA